MPAVDDQPKWKFSERFIALEVNLLAARNGLLSSGSGSRRYSPDGLPHRSWSRYISDHNLMSLWLYLLSALRWNRDQGAVADTVLVIPPLDSVAREAVQP